MTNALASELLSSAPPVDRNEADVIVVGAGPGGAPAPPHGAPGGPGLQPHP